PYLSEAARQFVGKRDRHRHQLGRLVAGVSHHQALVAGATDVHALRDVGGLATDRVEDAAGGVVEAVLRVGVADLAHQLAHQILNVDPALGCDLTADDHQANSDEALARDPTLADAAL